MPRAGCLKSNCKGSDGTKRRKHSDPPEIRDKRALEAVETGYGVGRDGRKRHTMPGRRLTVVTDAEAGRLTGRGVDAEDAHGALSSDRPRACGPRGLGVRADLEQAGATLARVADLRLDGSAARRPAGARSGRRAAHPRCAPPARRDGRSTPGRCSTRPASSSPARQPSGSTGAPLDARPVLAIGAPLTRAAPLRLDGMAARRPAGTRPSRRAVRPRCRPRARRVRRSMPDWIST
jgi:hypothetical protein